MNTKNKKQHGRITGLIPFLIVLVVSLALLLYIGLGDANRVYTKFHLNKVTAFGRIVTDSIESFLNSGFPLRQYVGFQEFTTPLLESEKTITRIEVADPGRNALFAADQKDVTDTGAGDDYQAVSALLLGGNDNAYSLEENGPFYRIVFPLESKFGTAGSLAIYTPKDAVTSRILASFLWVWIAAGAVILAFGLLLLLLSRGSGKGTKIGIQIGYAFSFLVVAFVIIFSLVNLYSAGIRGKTGALATSLATRLNAALRFDLDLSQFSGIDDVFDDYRKIDPDISYISLSENGTILIHTDRSREYTIQRPDPGLFEVSMPLSPGGEKSAPAVISMGIPKDRIYEQLFRSGKNFAVLLISTLFLSILFFNLLFSIRKKTSDALADTNGEPEKERKLELVKPIYFLTIFLEGLFISFLPLFFQQVAAGAQMDKSTASILFTIYFAAFVLSLIPTGKIADKTGIKGLLVCGAVLAAAGYTMLFFISDFYAVVVSRILAGFGQGMIFISVQSYILRTVSRTKKTQGSGIIVFGYNGGMISGTAIGALLVGSLGMRGVFLVAAVMGVLIVLYILLFVQGVRGSQKAAAADTPPVRPQPARNMFRALRDLDFIIAILCVGIVTKAVLTGVNSFALPLILDKMHYLKEDIGQIIILYSMAVLFSSRFITRIIDRFGNVRRFLFLGTQISGLALYVLGFAGWDVLAKSGIPSAETLVLVAGTIILGFGHGFIHAPIVTHISETRAAQTGGVSSTTSLYRFLERIGHVAGPLIVGPILYAMDLNAFTLSWIGGCTILMGILFFVIRRRRQTIDVKSLSE